MYSFHSCPEIASIIGLQWAQQHSLTKQLLRHDPLLYILGFSFPPSKPYALLSYPEPATFSRTENPLWGHTLQVDIENVHKPMDHLIMTVPVTPEDENLCTSVVPEFPSQAVEVWNTLAENKTVIHHKESFQLPLNDFEPFGLCPIREPLPRGVLRLLNPLMVVVR